MEVRCMHDGELVAAASGVFALGGNVAVTRLGYGAMRITGPGIWGDPADRGEAIRLLRRAGGLVRPGPDRWGQDARPEYLRECVEASLSRLGLDTIDLYQLHRIDPKIPAAEQVGELNQLRKEGKIRHIGLSEVSVAEIAEVRLTAPIASVQNLYNLLDRRHEAALDYCEREGLGFLPYCPIATGQLA